MTKHFIKLGEALEIGPQNIEASDSVFSDPEIEQRFAKYAGDLKRIAPKAEDFLYFSAVMMHSAERSLINDDGSAKLTSRGEPLKASWEKKGDSLKWAINDITIRPYKNSNGDIFPEEELLRAYKKWVGCPLCVDHKSASVDAIRGVILDTYYDRKLKRVIALCALDRVSYPELARKVSTGYSNCVSMGTAVGRAVCYDCGNVARVEGDFCSHMKSRSCYGEINCDLQPIELSIVVNGADPQAKIRTILAAANTLNDRLKNAEEVIDSGEQTKLQELEEDLRKANEKLAELKDEMENTEVIDKPYGQSSGQYAPPSDEVDQTQTPLNFPTRVAYDTNEVLVCELNKLLPSIEQRLARLEHKINNKEETMSDRDTMNKSAYYQGGGGVNEPTPGQKKYPVDPLNEKLRSEDKHMVGEPPFPEVGAVDGMHPSPSSVEQKDELERKKMLARAERRATALQQAKENIMSVKEAYFQGGGGVNEPAPHKVKYPIDPLDGKLRKSEDKQMVGQKPFPDVGAVDGLHPSPLSAPQKDELARKKLLQRASLKARFVRVANPDGSDDLGSSGWHVYSKDDSGEKLVFTASVDEISGGRSEVLFDTIATKDFGSKMLERIRTVGLDKAVSLYKRGQANAGPGAAPGGPQDVGGAGQAPAMPDMGAPAPDAGVDKEDGGKGDPKESALKLAEKVRDLSSDLVEAVKSLTGEQAEMGDLDQGLEALPKAASDALRPLSNMRKELNGALVSGMKKALGELRAHSEELDLVATIADADTSVNPEYANTVIEDAFNDAKKAIADGVSLMKAYIKYCRGTAGLVKRAEEAEEAALLSLATEDDADAEDDNAASDDADAEDDNAASDDSAAEDVADADENEAFDMNAFDSASDDLAVDDLNAHEHMGSDEDLDLGLGDLEDGGEKHHDAGLEGDGLGDDMPADLNDVMMDVPQGAVVMPKAASLDLTTKAGRAAFRAKLAADATGKEETGEIQSVEKMPHSDMLDKSESLADGQTKLDTKPSSLAPEGPLGNVETMVEQQKADLEIARMQPKVRKEAERLNQLISEGKVNPADLDELVKQGLDSEVVKYWRQFWGEAGKEGAEFGRLLTTETMKAKAAEEVSTFKVKISRAYELANEMVRRGLLTDDRISISAQVDEIMKWNDEGFESMKSVIAKSPMKKEASSIPQVGLIGSGEVYSRNPELDLQGELDRAFSGRKY
jgi:hypothetical protein